jgi:signal transduction histidine kinase
MIIWAVGTWPLSVTLWGVVPNVLLVFGSLTAGVIGWLAGVLIPRGLTVTRAAIAGAEEAQAARAVAASRWAARRREIRALHDTVLSTLSILAQGGAGVDPEALREQCAQQSANLGNARTRPESASVSEPAPSGTATERTRSAGALAPDGLLDLLERWHRRGLRVEVFGESAQSALSDLEPTVATELLLVIDQCLDNVLQHSGVRVAGLTLTRSSAAVCCVVSDKGDGFDPRGVPPDRLGLRECVLGRITDLGGHARVWTRERVGTSVALEIPSGVPMREPAEYAANRTASAFGQRS